MMGHNAHDYTLTEQWEIDERTTAMDVAKYIIDQINSGKYMYRGVNVLSLQKLLFFAQQRYLVLHNGEPLFGDDIIAWQFGPCVPNVYSNYSENAGAMIKKSINKRSINQFTLSESDTQPLNEEQCAVVDDVLDFWCNQPYYELTAAINNRENAWSIVYNESGLGLGYMQPIPKSLIIRTEDDEIVAEMNEKRKRNDFKLNTSRNRRNAYKERYSRGNSKYENHNASKLFTNKIRKALNRSRKK